MKFSEDLSGNRHYSITSASHDHFVINEQKVKESCLLAAKLLLPWDVRKLSDITAAHLEPIQAYKPEVIIIGTGSDFVFPEIDQLRVFVQLGIGYQASKGR